MVPVRDLPRRQYSMKALVALAVLVPRKARQLLSTSAVESEPVLWEGQQELARERVRQRD